MADIPSIIKRAPELASGAERLIAEALKPGENLALATPAIHSAKSDREIGVTLNQSNIDTFSASMLDAGRSWKNIVASVLQSAKR